MYPMKGNEIQPSSSSSSHPASAKKATVATSKLDQLTMKREGDRIQLHILRELLRSGLTKAERR